MEIVIVICLLIIIALLLQDKVVIKWKSGQKMLPDKVDPKLPDIMGRPKPQRGRSVPNRATERKNGNPGITPDNLDIEYDANETLGVQIPPVELDEAFGNITNLEEEEEEWKGYGISGGDDCFAQGVTFEELSSVGILLQKENLEPSQKETAVAIVQKIQGTELFGLLESSMEHASRKMAELLDSRLASVTDSGPTTLLNNDLEDFDIGQFL